MSREKKALEPAVRPRRHRPNKWWYKLAALSFTVKVVIVVGFILALKVAADAAATEYESNNRAPADVEASKADRQ